MMLIKAVLLALTTQAFVTMPILAQNTSQESVTHVRTLVQVRYRTASIDGVEVFYREAGPHDAPAILLLHGFPTSSHMFRELIPRLADRYRVIAPDYPAFGQSEMPDPSKFAYTFDNFAKIIGKLTQQIGLDTYALYVMDYGAPVGFRMATANPEKVTALIVQNGNAYEEGLSRSLDPMRAYWKTGKAPERDAVRALLTAEGTKWQYANGVDDLSLLSPDAWTLDQALLDRSGNGDIQLELFYDYRNNLPLYPQWQAYLRTHKPPTLVVWGKNDEIFIAPGGFAYKRDLPEAEIHMLDTGHFALETHGAEIASLIRDFMSRRVIKP